MPPARWGAVASLIGALAAACAAPLGVAPSSSPAPTASASEAPSAAASVPASVSQSSTATASASIATSPSASTRGGIAAELDPLLDNAARLFEAGVVVAAIDGSTTWTGVAGEADRAAGRPVTADTTFAIGSITKSMTAALVLRLAEDGDVDLDAPIAGYLPSGLSSMANGATVRQVLGHHSGIGEHTLQPFFEDVLADPERSWSNRDALRYVEPSTFPPGEGWAYSNTNYLLLDVLVEEVTGRPTGDVMDELLFEPHGLDRIAYQPTEPPAEPTAVGYSDVDGDGAIDVVTGGGLLPTRALATAAGAAGGVAADAPSVARWGHLLYGGDVLEPASLEAMLDFTGPHGPPYGLATEQVRYGGDLEGVGHTGGIPGFQSAVVHVPDRDATVAILTNGDFAGGPFDIVTILRPFVEAVAD